MSAGLSTTAAPHDEPCTEGHSRVSPAGGADTSERRRTSPFARFASAVATATGRPATFAAACAVVLVWAVSGPVFHWSDTWQLVINTGTTIVTFLMVFIIQNAQNRDGMAIQVKLDELIRATREAQDRLVGIEDMDDAVVERLRKEIHATAARGDHPAGGLEPR